MKKIALFVLISIILAACSADDKSFKVSSLKDSEYLEYEYELGSRSIDKTKLIIYKVDNNKREVIKEMIGLLSIDVIISNNKKDCFFLIDDGEKNNSLGNLWFLDGNTGKGEIILKTSPVFTVSGNSEFICYRENKYIKEEAGAKLAIPVVHVYSLKDRKIIKTLDYHDNELKDLYGVGVNVEYKKTSNSFLIKYYIEDYNIVMGKIDLNSMEFIRDFDKEENPFAIKN